MRREPDMRSAVQPIAAAAPPGEDELVNSAAPRRPPGVQIMLHYAVVFFVIALIAALFGFGGIAAGAAGIAKILFVVFIILAVATFLFGRNRGA
jgi:uncharacterized membrane protein YtjA (UPF0391 family)